MGEIGRMCDGLGRMGACVWVSDGLGRMGVCVWVSGDVRRMGVCVWMCDDVRRMGDIVIDRGCVRRWESECAQPESDREVQQSHAPSGCGLSSVG